MMDLEQEVAYLRQTLKEVLHELGEADLALSLNRLNTARSYLEYAYYSMLPLIQHFGRACYEQERLAKGGKE